MSDRAKRAPNALAADQRVCGCSARCVCGFDRPRRRLEGRRVAGRSQGTTVVDRPIEEVFGSSPMEERPQAQSAGPGDPQHDRRAARRHHALPQHGQGRGPDDQREYEITEFVAPSGSAGPRTPRTSSPSRRAAATSSPDSAGGTRLAMWNKREGHGPAKVLGAPRAPIGARAPGDFVGAIKGAVDAARARWSPASRALSCALAPSARRVNLEAVVTSRQPL
jgi:hypothetical protein